MNKVIDLSKYNVVTSWDDIQKNVKGVILRAGYRGYTYGKIVQDAKFVDFALACKDKNIPFGIYFMSQAITKAEAIEEATYIANFAEQYGAVLPLFIDSEDGDGTSKIVRADRLTKIERTTIVTTFCSTILEKGYKTGVYASESWFNANLDYNLLLGNYIWCAKYGKNTGSPSDPPRLSKTDIWQYTSNGWIPGVVGKCDINEYYIEDNVLVEQPVVTKKLTFSTKVLEWQKAMNIGFDKVDELSEDGFFGNKSKTFAKKHIIYFGLKGSPTAIKWVQKIVGVTQSGLFDNKTLNAVREWQRKNNLVPDGVFGLASTTVALQQ